MIIFKNVSKKFNSQLVLDRINVEINGGELVSLVGPSGAGKSTFINLLIGAIKPSIGQVLVDQNEITKLSEIELALYRRKLGIVFQDFKLLSKKTVAENVAFALEVCGESNELIQKRVSEVLEIVGLTNRAQAFPAELSGGECSRVGIARALAHSPALIIADEPTGNLDPNTGQEIIKLLFDINQAGATVLLATHDREIVNQLQSRVIRLNKGKLVSDLQIAGYDE
jgi:cell division transport system ATP-binding protein